MRRGYWAVLVPAIVGALVCGGVSEVKAQTYNPPPTLYAFQGGSDGLGPESLLINIGTTLYGTTAGGGTGTACTDGCGTVYSLTTTGIHKVLYSFQGGSDGSAPATRLLDVKGALYGTTPNGSGSANCSTYCGTVYSLTKVKGVWVKALVYAFQGGTADGEEPQAALMELNGDLYGTTLGGGTYGYGTVFKLTPPAVAGGAWSESVLYSFQGSPNDISAPGALMYIKSTVGGIQLYGYSEEGGANFAGGVFHLTLDGSSEDLIASFPAGSADFSAYDPGLTLYQGYLYGTRFKGPSVTADLDGWIFSIKEPPQTAPGQTETINNVYSFYANGENNDSATLPLGGMILVNNKFYGVTFGGGGGNYGTVYSFAPKGNLTGTLNVLYDFYATNGDDGIEPAARLLSMGGKIYGSATSGGPDDAGVVFSFTP